MGSKAETLDELDAKLHPANKPQFPGQVTTKRGGASEWYRKGESEWFSGDEKRKLFSISEMTKILQLVVGPSEIPTPFKIDPSTSEFLKKNLKNKGELLSMRQLTKAVQLICKDLKW